MKLTPDQLALLPSDEDVQFYQEHGYYHSRTLFSAEEMDAVLAASERFYAGEVDEPSVEVPYLDRFRPKESYGAGLRKSDYSSMYSHGLRWLVTHPLLGAIAARLSGSPHIRLWHDQLLYKPPQDPLKPTNVGWHTDRGYWKTCTSPDMLTAWIPFHDCDTEMGTITMIDGSQHWPDNTNNLDFFSSDLDGLERKFSTGGQPIIKVPMSLLKGQVSFHNCLTIHGSGPNLSAQPRRAIAVHLQDEANRYQEYTYPDGRPAQHANDHLCRQVDGFPDYTDPDFCPVLY